MDESLENTSIDYNQPSTSKIKSEIQETDDYNNENERLQRNEPTEDDKQMIVTEDITEKPEIKYFKCYLCDLEEQYDYFGRNPPYVKKFVMEEDCYMMEDPFIAPRNKEFLTLGSNCSVCEQPVCKDPGCSFFYLNTYCVKCLKIKRNKLPEFLHEKIKRILKQ